MLPREKPLPKPKPLTKWERFANAKGISHVKKDKKVWDDERQEWVARWGRDGKNKDAEDQWLHEVKNNGSGEFKCTECIRYARRGGGGVGMGVVGLDTAIPPLPPKPSKASQPPPGRPYNIIY